MASTPNQSTSSKKPASVGKIDKPSPKRSPNASNNSKPNKPRGSMGLDLLLIAIGTSLIGLGVLGYLFYQELLSSSQREIDRSAESQSRQIESNLSSVRQSVDGVASAVKILSQQPPKPKTVESYQKLLVDGLQKAELVSGIGIAQNENLLFPAAKPTVPYVWKEQSGLKPETAAQKLAAPNDKLLSGNRPDIQNSSFYKVTIKGKESWSEPYNALGKPVITYSAPINDGSKVLGVVNGDAIASNLLPIASSGSENKIGFVIVSAGGTVITSSDQFQATQAQNPAITEALSNLTQQSKAQPTGIAQTGGNLWAYRKIEGSNLLVVAYLPQSEIINKLVILVGGAAIGISAILAIAILGFVNSLKKRLQPLTEECDRFLTQQGNPDINVAAKDEIEQLSLSLKSTLQQAKTNEIRLRSAAISPAPSEQISAEQMQQSFTDTELMEAEVGDLLDVVSSMEEGDLTIEAQVNDRATGLVADTLNRLREKLVEIISSVLGTAQQVAQGASDLEELARTVVLNTAEQAQSVTEGQSLTEQVAAIAQRSVTQVNVANQSLQEVRDIVASGQTSINNLTESITVLQTGSAQIVQRMKTLGEFVGLAEQFVQDQGQIASLTQVLALNATLVAARAAEQKDPKQFAGVAREFESIAGQVNDLATQTNDGLTVLQQRTSQIQTVVTAIDVEVQNLSGLVSGFTTGVEDSQTAFNSIQTATQEVVQIAQTITESSTEIAEAAGSTASYISEIAQLADRTANLTRSARQQAEAMGNQAQQLLQGIQFFRLPESAQVSTSTNISNTSTVDKFVDTSTSINSLFDAPTEPRSADDSSGYSQVVPAIALASVAATAIGVSQIGQIEQDGNEYLVEENLANESNEFDSVFDLPSELGFVDAPEDFIANTETIDPFLDISESQDQIAEAPSLEPLELTDDLTDISVIEESLLADLRQEVYEEEVIEDDNADARQDMLGVDELAIAEASSDPMIASATSSFLEDTTFGSPSPLSEDALANLPTSIDFTIPDLDSDVDFEIPNGMIESTLDDSNSFFDASSIPQVDTSDVDFDPFYMDEDELAANDDSIEDNIFETNFLDSNVPEALPSEPLSEDNDPIFEEVLDESLEGTFGNLPNDFLGDRFDISFDESSFDSFDSPFDQELQLENQDDLIELSTPEPNVHLSDSLTDSLPIESELDESDDFFSFNLEQDSEELVDALDIYTPEIPDNITPNNTAVNVVEESSATAFPSMFSEEFSEEFDEDLESEDDLLWQSEAIISDLSDLMEEELLEAEILNFDETPNFDEAPNAVVANLDADNLDIENFGVEEPSFSDMVETDDNALLDQVFSFDTSDDLDFSPNLLEVEKEEINADISSVFSMGSNLEDDLEFDFAESLNIFENPEDDNLQVDANTLYVDEFEEEDEFDEDMESAIEFIDIGEISKISDILESGTFNASDAFEESAILEVRSPDLITDLTTDLTTEAAPTTEFIENPDDALISEISEVDDLGLASEFTESIPDLSLDFSDEWLGDINDVDEEEDENIENFDDFTNFSIEYPSMDVSSSDMSTISDYGFADNLLDSLMEESDEEIKDIFEDDSEDMLMDSLLESSLLIPSSSDPEIAKAEEDDSESQFDFDFSAFDDLDADELEDEIVTARAEIDDFLSGVLGMEDMVETKKPQPLETNKKPHGEIPPTK